MKKRLLLMISIFFIGTNFVYAKETVKFSKCVDGDTFKGTIGKEEYTIRMLAIDTPESVHPNKQVEYYGKEASEYTCNKLQNAKKITLEYDSNSDKFDKYDRILAWVFTDGDLLQEELIEHGYAKVAYLYGDYKYTKSLEAKQELASAKGLGVWNEEAKAEFEKENNKNITDDMTDEVDKYTTKEIIIIVVLLLIIAFVSDKAIKKKAKKKLKKYLN